MKSTFKTLSFIFFISLMLLACPLYSKAEEEASAQTKDIQLLISDDKVIEVSLEDIKERFLKGQPVHFVEGQEDGKRTIKAELITTALEKEYGVEKIDIENAIITGDLDFRMKENLVNIDESGIKDDEIKELKDKGYENVFLVSSSINIKNCQLQGNLEAGYNRILKSIVIFENSVNFINSTIVKEAGFLSAIFKEEAVFIEPAFNGRAEFGDAIFHGVAIFQYAAFMSVFFNDAIFNEKASFEATDFKDITNFRNAEFKKEAHFQLATFKNKAVFRDAIFIGIADFQTATFMGNADYNDATFKSLVVFEHADFKEKVNFRSSIFKNAYFNEPTFNGVADFGDATFNGMVTFRNSTFKDVAIFSGCTFLLDIDLRDTSYQVFRISWKQLEGLLDWAIHDIFNLPEDIKDFFKGNKTVDKYLEKKINNILKIENISLWEQTYLRLIKNFEDIGDKKSADDAYYHYRYNKPKYESIHLSERSEYIGEMSMGLVFPENLKSKIDYKDEQLIFDGIMSEEEKEKLLGLQEELPDSYNEAVKNLYKRSQHRLEYVSAIRHFRKWLEHNLFGRTCGYGVRPLNAIGVGLLLITFFTIFYFIGCLQFPHKEYLVYQRKEEGNFSAKPIHYKLYNCFYFSVTTFTTVGYGDLQPRGSFKVAAMIEGFLGWMTMALFLVTLGNVWLR